MKFTLILFSFLCSFFTCALGYCAGDYLIGAHYWSGWWRDPPTHFILRNGVDWRTKYPERQPYIDWYDDRQNLVDQEIIMAAFGGVNFFSFDFYANIPPNNKGLDNLNEGLNFFMSSPYNSAMKFVVDYVNDPRFMITDPAMWNTYTDLWISYFKHPSYLRINGKPVFIVLYSDNMINQWGSIANVKNVLNILRQKAQKAGFPGIIIGGGVRNPLQTGTINNAINSGYDFLTAYDSVGNVTIGPHPYSQLLQIAPATWNTFLKESSIPYTPIVMEGRDSRPIMGTNTGYFIDKTPEIFGEELLMAKNFVDQHPNMNVAGKKIIIINAWNELFNGGELIPNFGESFDYLYQIPKIFG